MSLNTAPFLPLLLELAVVIGKNSLESRFCFSKGTVISVFVNSWVKLLSTSLSTSFNAQICPNAALKSSTTHAIVKSVPRRLDGYNLGACFDLDHTTVELLNVSVTFARATCHHSPSTF